MPQNASPAPLADVDLGILLGLAYEGFVVRLNARLRERGFTDLGRWYGYVFRALAAEPLSLAELGPRLGMTVQGAKKIVDEMEARGYVERTSDADDARVKRLRLAPRGRQALAAARRIHRDVERELGRARAKRLRAILLELADPSRPDFEPLLRPM